MRHHSEYDSTTSQHKNYTISELKLSRNRLYGIIASGKHLKGRTPSLWPDSGYEGFQKVMADIEARLNERFAKSGSKGEAPTLREVLDQGRRLVDAALERLLPPPTHFPRSIHQARLLEYCRMRSASTITRAIPACTMARAQSMQGVTST
jgi:hypothetical protein